MSAIEDLKSKVRSLESQLSAAKKSLHAAMIEAEPLKAGDIVEVVTPVDRWNASDNSVRIERGQVRGVGIWNDRLRIEIAPQTKSGYHSCNAIHVGYGATIRKVDAALLQARPEGGQ